MSRSEQVERHDSLIDALQILTEYQFEAMDEHNSEAVGILGRAANHVAGNLIGNGVVESEKYPSLIWDGNAWTLPESE